MLVPIRFHKSGEADVTANFTVYLLDKNEAPTATGFATSYQLTEDGTTSKTATETPVISDPDAGDTLDTLIVRAIYRPVGYITQQIVATGQDYALALSAPCISAEPVKVALAGIINLIIARRQSMA